jgi:hypothetical protein
MTSENANLAMQWAEENHFVSDGKITDLGRGFFLLHKHEKTFL